MTRWMRWITGWGKGDIVVERDYMVEERDYEVDERDYEAEERDYEVEERNYKVDERDYELDEKDDTHIKVDAFLAVSVTPGAVLLPWRTKIVNAFTKRRGRRDMELYHLQSCRRFASICYQTEGAKSYQR